VLLLGEISFAQNNSKGIFIVNTSSKTPVQDATVQSGDPVFNASSDENGFVSLKTLPASIVRLIITAIAYETQTVERSGDSRTDPP
jgi:hypothetical protein